MNTESATIFLHFRPQPDDTPTSQQVYVGGRPFTMPRGAEEMEKRKKAAKRQIKTLMEAGVNVIMTVSDNGVTHVVFYNGSLDLLESCAARSIPVVTPGWLKACAKAGRLVDTRPYCVTLGEAVVTTAAADSSSHNGAKESADRRYNSLQRVSPQRDLATSAGSMPDSAPLFPPSLHSAPETTSPPPTASSVLLTAGRRAAGVTGTPIQRPLASAPSVAEQPTVPVTPMSLSARTAHSEVADHSARVAQTAAAVDVNPPRALSPRRLEMSESQHNPPPPGTSEAIDGEQRRHRPLLGGSDDSDPDALDDLVPRSRRDMIKSRVSKLKSSDLYSNLVPAATREIIARVRRHPSILPSLAAPTGTPLDGITTSTPVLTHSKTEPAETFSSTTPEGTSRGSPPAAEGECCSIAGPMTMAAGSTTLMNGISDDLAFTRHVLQQFGSPVARPAGSGAATNRTAAAKAMSSTPPLPGAGVGGAGGGAVAVETTQRFRPSGSGIKTLRGDAMPKGDIKTASNPARAGRVPGRKSAREDDDTEKDNNNTATGRQRTAALAAPMTQVLLPAATTSGSDADDAMESSAGSDHSDNESECCWAPCEPQPLRVSLSGRGDARDTLAVVLEGLGIDAEQTVYGRTDKPTHAVLIDDATDNRASLSGAGTNTNTVEPFITPKVLFALASATPLLTREWGFASIEKGHFPVFYVSSPAAKSLEETTQGPPLSDRDLLRAMPREEGRFVHQYQRPLVDLLTAVHAANESLRLQWAAEGLLSEAVLDEDGNVGASQIDSPTAACGTAASAMIFQSCDRIAAPDNVAMEPLKRRRPEGGGRLSGGRPSVDSPNNAGSRRLMTDWRSRANLAPLVATPPARELLYTTLRKRYLGGMLRGVTVFVLGQHKNPPNRSIIELISLLGGSTVRSPGGPLSLVLDLDNGQSFRRLCETFSRNKFSSPRTATTANAVVQSGGDEDDDNCNAGDEGRETLRRAAFEAQFPHCRYLVQLQWLWDCIAKQSLFDFRAASPYLILGLPAPQTGYATSDVDADRADEASPPSDVPHVTPPPNGATASSAQGGSEQPKGFQAPPLEVGGMSTPRHQSSLRPFKSSTSRHLEPSSCSTSSSSESSQEPAPSRGPPPRLSSSVFGRPSTSGRLSGGGGSEHRKMRRGPSSAVKNPNLQISTQQLHDETQLSLV